MLFEGFDGPFRKKISEIFHTACHFLVTRTEASFSQRVKESLREREQNKGAFPRSHAQCREDDLSLVRADVWMYTQAGIIREGLTYFFNTLLQFHLYIKEQKYVTLVCPVWTSGQQNKNVYALFTL